MQKIRGTGFPEHLYLLPNQYFIMQRRILFLATLFLSVTYADGQFKQGDKMIGTSVGTIFFNSGNSDISVANIGTNTSKITSYGVTVNPSYGWFVSDNTVIGATLNINPNGQKTTYEQNGSTYQSDESNGFNIGAGGFVRNYFPGSGSLLPFAQASINGGLSNLKTEGFFYYAAGSPLHKYTYSGSSSGGVFVNTTLTGGLTKMVGENAGLDFYIGYNFSYNKNTFNKTTRYYLSSNDNNPSTGENETTTKFTNHGFTIGVGFQVFLRGKK